MPYRLLSMISQTHVVSIKREMEESNTKIEYGRTRKELSDLIDEKFKRRKNGKISYIWEQIQRFHSDQGNFKLKELEFYVRKEAKKEKIGKYFWVQW